MKMRRRKFKLKITEHGITRKDRDDILIKHQHLADIRRRAKNVSKGDKDLIKIFKNEIKSVRYDLINNYAHKFFNVTIALGPHKEDLVYSYYPTTDDITQVKEKLIQRLSKDRAAKKEVRKIRKQFNGIEYEMVGSRDRSYNTNPFAAALEAIPMPTLERVDGRVTWTVGGDVTYTDHVDTAMPGGIIPKVDAAPKKVLLQSLKGGGNVFMESGSMLKLLDGPGYANRINKAKKPYDKSNYVGVEIELICKASRDTLEKAFIAARLAGNVYLKDDTSIAREAEGEWTHEITMLGKQQHINNIISRACDVLNAKEIGTYVNDSCGIHVHVDMRNRNYLRCFSNFVKALPVLVSMVPASRTQSKYCKPNTFTDPNANTDRRQAINPISYGAHRTVEVRLHSGSTNAMKINNWVNILTAIADKNEDVNDIQSPEEMQQVFGVNDSLVEYMKNRINKFKNKTINTKDDHFDQSA